MNKKPLRSLASLVVTSFILISCIPGSTTNKVQQREKLIMQITYSALFTQHLQPPVANAELSQRIFSKAVENFDVSKKFFLKSDIDEYSKQKNNMLKMLQDGDVSLFEKMYQRILQRIKEAEELANSQLNEPIKFSKKEVYETDDDRQTFAKNAKELQENWKKYLKYRVLVRLYESIDTSTTDQLLVPEITEQAEQEARKKEREQLKEWFDMLRDMDRNDWFGLFINAYSQNFDPHTEYYPPQRQEDFEIEMTGQFEGIGAQLVNRDGFVTIERIVPGSASWRQGELEEGDKILRVTQENGEATDVVGMSIQKVVKLIRGKKGTKVTLTVRKADGSRRDITIVRDVVEMEAAFARSAIAEYNGLKLGYIRLPKFYVDFYKETNRNCAQDMRTEVDRLKKEGVAGIIVDLRSNGGGTLEGAIDIAGLFIPSGPIVQVKATGQPARVLSDRDPALVYDGPLVVMVNHFSASASEIFAAAMQDYGRALIIGPNHTFGKGTVQNMLDYDRAVGFGNRDMKPLGSLKITIQKYYRINGGTPQLKGVTPDIVIPDQYSYLDFGERELKNAIAYSEIAPATYTRWTQNATFPSAIEKAKKRIAENPKFQLMESYARWLANNKEKSAISLKWEEYIATQRRLKEESKRYKDVYISTDSIPFVIPTSTVAELTQKGDDQREWKKWVGDLSRDVQLQEAIRVLYDLR
ncbi:carboxy terminal-processing peptidase [Thermaurantimonas aggregans]|uniref:carboxy terminal-processing peptidase n=1 Tax=Thermaurantimonas aggregans TaxID=2173829 RepID=UPI0023F32D8D|nr:carboxy terminal-processing peptidase [Thermaurantimonas aggregans]MCX8149683.1 carboxy terminal-processing peptidase [Thermaurantimonas aggregans]